MINRQIISKFFRCLLEVSALLYFWGIFGIAAWFYGEPYDFLYCWAAIALAHIIIFIITLIVTFFAYSRVFKNKEHSRLYLTLGFLAILACILFILFFYLMKIYPLSFNFFINYDWIFLLILIGLVGLFLFYHTYLKFKSDELEDLHTTRRTLKFVGISFLIAAPITFFILVRVFLLADILTLVVSIHVVFLCTSLIGSFHAITRSFGIFGSFKKYKDKIDLSLEAEVIIFFLSLLCAIGIWLAFVGLELLV
ncbi:MAG: hypothetical protein HWN65_14745 [Candidatus Helarchaeota archaeon]|nr:hypothetical protein [Candidatus Helarchaeota archaeon]